MRSAFDHCAGAGGPGGQVESGQRVVVFSQWRCFLDLAHSATARALEAAGVHALFFSGNETLPQRAQHPSLPHAGVRRARQHHGRAGPPLTLRVEHNGVTVSVREDIGAATLATVVHALREGARRC